MNQQRHTLLVVTLVVVAGIAGASGGAAAASGLTVDGEQAADGTVTVTVTENGTAVANATVAVEALNNSSYAGSGAHTTGENGTVSLPAPEQNVSVELTASTDNSSATTTLSLVAPADEENAGEDAGDESDPFGLLVSNYVQVLKDEGNTSGQTIADFVTANNPGADHRSDNADPGPNDDEDDEAGNGNGHGNDGNAGNGNGNGQENGNGNGPDNGNGSGHGKGSDNGNGSGHGSSSRAES